MLFFLCDLCVLCGQFIFGCGWPRRAFCAFLRQINGNGSPGTTYIVNRAICNQAQSTLIKANQVIFMFSLIPKAALPSSRLEAMLTGSLYAVTFIKYL